MESATMSEPLQTPAERDAAPAKRQSTALAVVHKDEILARIRDGEITRNVAADYGITGQAIRKALANDPDYHAAKFEQAASMIEDAHIETWAARDPVAIARAREMTKFAFRYAESVDPQRWGQKQQVQVDAAISISIVKSGRIIDASDNQSAALPAPSPDESGS